MSYSQVLSVGLSDSLIDDPSFQDPNPPQPGVPMNPSTQYTTPTHGAYTSSAQGPPPPIPGNRPPPIPGNRPGVPTAPAAPMPVPQHILNNHTADAPFIPIPVHAASGHASAQSTNADNILLTIVYNGLVVPNPRAPPPPYGNLKVQGYNPLVDAETIMNACKGFGTDEAALIKTLTKIVPLKMDALADFYVSKYGQRLVDHIDKKTRSWFGMGLHGLVTGPLAWDVELLHEAVDGVGTDEDLLTELIIDRSSDDLYRLSVEYKYKYGSDLSVKIRDDLSGQTEKLYLIALNARRPTESTPIDYTLVDKDILDLFNAGQGKRGRNEFLGSVGGYGAKYRSLTKVIKSEFTGHMRASLLFAVEGVKPKRDQRGIWRDAKMIDKAMVGFGTRDKQLVYRIVRAQWDRERFVAIKEAYHRRTGKTLESRVKSETSGDYQKLMLALIKGD
ncbi:hypothetical protein C0989_012210 [Termitomyces sp. Mn162]|nr:hypothetical protein C0989_012210 [Termitomyces sp. Mn162]